MNSCIVLLPPMIAIVVALLGKDVIVALFLGSLLAAVIGHGNGFLGALVNDYMMNGLADNAYLLSMILLTGILMELIKSSGGFQALSYQMSKKIKSARGAKLFAWLVCICCCTDDGMATVGAGAIAAPVIEKYLVPRTKLALILSSTGSNFLSVMPYSMYVAFGCGLLAPYLEKTENAIAIYFRGVTLNMFAIFSLVMVLLVCLELFPEFSKRQESNKGATEKTEKCQEEAQGDLWMLLLPMFSMVSVFVITFLRTGGFQIHEAVLTAILTAFLYQLFRKKLHAGDVSAICFRGFQSVSPIVVILVFAFTFSKALSGIGVSDYLTQMLGGKIPGSILPVSIFLICCAISYCTGSFASSMTMMIPIAMPLAVSAGCYIPLAFAACMGGSQFGDQTSPISDVFILSSMAAGVDVVESAKAQLPYKLIVMSAAAVMFLCLGLLL